MTQDNKEQVRFIRFPELQEILGGVSRAKIERDVASGELPAPFKLGRRMVASSHCSKSGKWLISANDTAILKITDS